MHRYTVLVIIAAFAIAFFVPTVYASFAAESWQFDTWGFGPYGTLTWLIITAVVLPIVLGGLSVGRIQQNVERIVSFLAVSFLGSIWLLSFFLLIEFFLAFDMVDPSVHVKSLMDRPTIIAWAIAALAAAGAGFIIGALAETAATPTGPQSAGTPFLSRLAVWGRRIVERVRRVDTDERFGVYAAILAARRRD